MLEQRRDSRSVRIGLDGWWEVGEGLKSHQLNMTRTSLSVSQP